MEWQPFREPLRVTLTRTLSIAIIAGGIIAMRAGGLRMWPVISLLVLWPSVGGHWVDLLFLNGIRPHLPPRRPVQALARVALWFVAGIVLGIGVQLTASLLHAPMRLAWLTWGVAGALFVGVELVAHAGLHLRARPSFYDGLG